MNLRNYLFSLICLLAMIGRGYGQDANTIPNTDSWRNTSETNSEIHDRTNANLSTRVAGRIEVTQPTSNSRDTEGYVFPSKGDQFSRYLRDLAGPTALARTAVVAGLRQWRDNPVEWGQGSSGYGKRVASAFGENAIQHSITFGLDTTLGLDTGFKLSKRKGFFPRMKDALAQNVTSRTRSGRRVVSAPRLAGLYGARVISTEAWYPSRYSYKDGLRRGNTSLLTGFGINLVREFIIRR